MEVSSKNITIISIIILTVSIILLSLFNNPYSSLNNVCNGNIDRDNINVISSKYKVSQLYELNLRSNPENRYMNELWNSCKDSRIKIYRTLNEKGNENDRTMFLESLALYSSSQEYGSGRTIIADKWESLKHIDDKLNYNQLEGMKYLSFYEVEYLYYTMDEISNNSGVGNKKNGNYLIELLGKQLPGSENVSVGYYIFNDYLKKIIEEDVNKVGFYNIIEHIFLDNILIDGNGWNIERNLSFNKIKSLGLNEIFKNEPNSTFEDGMIYYRFPFFDNNGKEVVIDLKYSNKDEFIKQFQETIDKLSNL